MNGFLCTLTLEEPVLANSLGGDPNSANSLFYIPGGAIRGAFIQAYGANNDSESADFQRLFLNGETRFLNAYPSVEGLRALPTPLTWQVERKSDPKVKTKKVYRDLEDVPSKLGGDPLDTKSAPFGFWIWQNNILHSVEEKWQVNIHTQRDAIRGRATTESGAVYRYVALPAGLTLQGVVLTSNKADALALEKLLESKTILLGKARTAGYGRVRIVITPLPDDWHEISLQVEQIGSEVRVTLLSPCIVRDANGQYSLDIEPFLKARFGQDVSATPLQRRSEIIAGFNRKWGLPLPQMTAISAGSVFVITNAKADVLKFLEEQGIGERRAEGFGRLAINLDIPTPEATWKKSDPDMVSQADGELSAGDPLAQMMITRLLRRKLDEYLVHTARQALADYKVGQVPNSQLQRWRVIVRDALQKKTGMIERVQAFYEAENKKRSAAWGKMERAHLKIGTTPFRLTAWIESLLADPQALYLGWEKDHLTGIKLGSANSIAMDDALNAEYRLRQLDAVLALMAKSGVDHDN